MNIAVVLRLMPSLGDELEVDDTGVDIDREIVEMVINEFDEQALEEAVLIKEATGATVTALALAADGAEQALRVAFARGADRAVLVDTGEVEPYDTRTASLAFAQALRQLGSDLVLTGVQTPYDVFGQAAPYLAAELGWPQANVVVGTTVTRRNRTGRTGVHGRTPCGPGPHAARGRRCAIGEQPAALRVDGAPAPGHVRSLGRDDQCRRRAPGRGAQDHRPGAAGPNRRRDDARG